MITLFSFLKSLFSIETRAVNARVQESATQDTLGRISVSAIVVGVINLGYAILFLILLADEPHAEALRKVWLKSIGWIHVTTGLCMLLLFFSSRVLLKHPPSKRWVLLYQLLFGAVIIFLA